MYRLLFEDSSTRLMLVLFFFFLKKQNLFVYLAVPDLICGMQDL